MKMSSALIVNLLVLWFFLVSIPRYAVSYDGDWINGGDITFYGPPVGDGSDGGACGYENLSTSPYGSSIFAGSNSLFNNGLSCGACYQVKCNVPQLCNANGVKVVQTDQCPGCAGTHFDLSDVAFSALATPGNADKLKQFGQLAVQYKRVPCSFVSNIAFKVSLGSNRNSLDVLVKYVAGPGDISAVSFLQAGTNTWLPGRHVWGAHFVVDVPGAAGLQGPISISVTGNYEKKSVVATNVLPADWRPGQEYVSNVQF